MLFKRRLAPKLMQLTSVIYPRCGYHWGNYDASSGGCCKMQTTCKRKTECGKARSVPNLCNFRVVADSKLDAEFPKKLMEIIRKDKSSTECELFKHDVCYYQPSNKNRRYQRTWSECPRIWLRPKPTCCFDKEYYSPIERRPRPPPQAKKTTADMYAFQMDQICKYTPRMGHQPRKRCNITKVPQDCEKIKAPFPSFSESNKECIPQFCPTECACKIKPNMCEMWRLYHHNLGLVKKCTEAAANICTFKKRARPLTDI